MSKYLDNKVDELMSCTMVFKRCFHHHYLHISDKSTVLQLETLMLVNTNPKISMREVGEHLKMSMSSATQLIERLVGNKLLVRLFDDSDRRIIRLDLTMEGREEVEKKHNFIKEKIRTVFSVLSDDELKDYLRVMKKIISNQLP